MYLHARHFRLSVIAAALSTALAAHAQQAAPAAAPASPTAPVAAPVQAQPAAMQRVEVTGTADSYDARRDDTASKIVLNSAEIVKFGDTSVLDVLKRLPGVTVSGASGRGGEVRMRGLGSGYTQVLVNGERAPAGFSMESLAPDSIERIEVLRSASAEFSTQAVAGTINIVLKRAIKPGLRELKLTVGAAERQFTPSYNLQMSDRKGQLSYSVTVNGVHNRFKRDTPSIDTITDQDGNVALQRRTSFAEDGRFDAINIGPRVNWTFENGDTLTSQSFLNFARFPRLSESEVTPLITPPDGGTPVVPYLDWVRKGSNMMFRTDLNWVKKLKEGAKLDIKVGGVLGRVRNFSGREGFTARDGEKRLDSEVTGRGTDRNYNTVGKYSTPIFEGHALSMGWDLGFTTRDDLRIQRDLIWKPSPAPGALVARPLDEDFRGEITRLNAYVQDEWNVTPRWSVYLGLRWEDVSTKVKGTGFPDFTTNSTVWSPIFQTLYKLPNTQGDQLRLALSRTYRAPDMGALIPRRYASPNHKYANEPDTIGNPALRPELATGIDVAYEHYWEKGAMFSVSAYARRITDFTRNLVTTEPDPDEPGIIYVARPVNSGNADTYGIELEAKFPLQKLIASAPALDLRANLTRNWSSVDSVPFPRNWLDQQTPFSGTVGADYKSGRLTAGASYSFRSAGYVRLSAEQAVFASVRRDLELYGLWKFDPKNQLRVALINVLAQDIINESIYYSGTSVSRDETTFPQPAQIRATWEVKF